MPVIDPKILEKLADDLGRDVVAQLLDIFTADLHRRKNLMEDAAAQGDWYETARHAHALKSSAASCGLIDFSAYMNAIEAAAKGGDLETVAELAAQLEQQMSPALAALGESQTAYRVNAS